MIQLSNIRKVYNQGQPNEFCALNGIDLHIQAHKVTALSGPSGSGKSTMLSIIGCMARPTSGRVQLAGRDISGLPERFLSDIRRTTFGFIFQHYSLIRGLSARDNVRLPAYPLGGDWRALHERADRLLDHFKLGQRRHALVETLSGGEQQRVAMARALINDPQVVIADEPTAQLDTALAREFMAILEDLKQQGKTILLSSHDPLVVESSVVDCVVRLRDGQLLEAAE